MTVITASVPNATFCSGDVNLNACVGTNGHPDLHAYADGFLEAAKNLLFEVVSKRRTDKCDIWIYPIAFNARHGIELVLKGVLLRLGDLRENVHVELKYIKTHNIEALWNEIFLKGKAIDRRFDELLDKISPHINDYVAIDPTGETFRYPRDQAKNIHLKNTPHINLGIFYDQFQELTELLEDLDYLTRGLEEEFSLGTYTAFLSRHDLENIAQALPEKDKWVDHSFDKISAHIQATYGIGKRQYSIALNLIKSHPTFASRIGIRVPLKSATSEHLRIYLGEWRKIHPPRGANVNDLGHDHFEDADKRFDEIKKYAAIKAQAITEIKALPKPSIAEVAALYHLGRDLKYCERYPKAVQDAEAEVNSITDAASLSEFVNYYLTKTNLMECVFNGLEIMGRSDLVAELSNI